MENNPADTSNDVLERRQRRSLFVVMSGVAVICPGLLLIAVVIAGFFHSTDPPIFSVMLAPFACFLGWLSLKQYCSLFCCEPTVARAYHEAYFTVGGLCLLGAFASFCEYLDESKQTDNGILYFLSGMAIFGLVCVVVGWINDSMTRSRRAIAATYGLMKENDFQTKPFGTSKYRTRTIMGIVIMSGIVFLMTCGFVWDERRFPPSAENLSYEQFPYKSFPAEGQDFSYRRLYRGTMYCEFTVSEQGFRNWINSEKRWEYCESIESINVQRLLSKENINDSSVSITDGLHAGYGRGRGGQAVFDRSTNRAYYWTYY
jgi:hypothetical protein